MGIRKTKFIKGNYYHIYNRGCNKDHIFYEEKNYRFLLKKINKYYIECNISIIAYCLMPNHYHFLLRQDSDIPISKFVQSIFNSYTKAINKMYNRSGTLFENKYKSIHVSKENYLLHLCRYIHRNPLEAKLVNNLSDWKYSNYPEWIGIRKGKLFDREFMIERFGSISKYVEFVSDNKEYSFPDNFENLKID